MDANVESTENAVEKKQKTKTISEQEFLELADSPTIARQGTVGVNIIGHKEVVDGKFVEVTPDKLVEFPIEYWFCIARFPAEEGHLLGKPISPQTLVYGKIGDTKYMIK